MKKCFLLLSVCVCFLLLQPATSLAAVIINEICWMGSVNSPNDEWLEFFNSDQSMVNLDGWLLKSTDEKLKINLKGNIPAGGFFLLERTDDNSIPNASADQIYQGALSNKGEKLQILNNLGQLADEVDCSSGWPAGDNKTKQTMERAYRGSSPVSWQTSAMANGTPKTTNSQGITNSQLVKPSPLPTSESPEGSSLGITHIQPIEPMSPTYPKNIFINEILPSPEGADEQNEWLEIYNDNDFEVDLAGWQIKDQVGAIKTYTWPENSPLKAKGFLTVSRAQSKIVLQNNGDGLTLINPQGTVADQIVYPSSPANQSYNRANSGWVWSRLLTPDNANIIDKTSAAVQQKISQKNQSTSVPATSATSSNFSRAGAQINNFAPKSSRFLTFILGVVIAMASALAVLFLRKKMKKDPNLR